MKVAASEIERTKKVVLESVGDMMAEHSAHQARALRVWAGALRLGIEKENWVSVALVEKALRDTADALEAT